MNPIPPHIPAATIANLFTADTDGDSNRDRVGVEAVGGRNAQITTQITTEMPLFDPKARHPIEATGRIYKHSQKQQKQNKNILNNVFYLNIFSFFCKFHINFLA